MLSLLACCPCIRILT